MQLSPVMKIVLALVLVMAGAAYLLLLEFAVNAGRVHRGVSVRGVDVGGLNSVEAEEVLRERGKEMKSTPLLFTTEGFDCRFTPRAVGWGPQPFDTTSVAMAVGRDGSIVEALRDRWRAWTEGIDVSWAGDSDPAKVERELDRCEELAGSLGVQIDRDRLRHHVESAVERWPREPLTLPLRA
jgi:hypothetical protein